MNLLISQHIFIKYDKNIFAFSLGFIQSAVRFLIQVVKSSAVVRFTEHHPDTAGYLQSFFCRAFSVQTADLPGFHQGIFHTGDITHQHRKFIAADTAQQIRAAEAALKIGSKLTQNRITEGMAPAVVNIFKIINIQQEKGMLPFRAVS